LAQHIRLPDPDPGHKTCTCNAVGQKGIAAMRGDKHGTSPEQQVAYDESAFWQSYYRAHARGRARLSDWTTIGVGTDPEARFHYNSVENSIIRALLRREPVAGVAPEVWRFAQRRRNLRLLDIGSGAGHWIDFFRDAFLVSGVVGVEITPQMVDFLKGKYEQDEAVTILGADIAADTIDVPGGAVDIISAIGVMFHIVDDARWRRALANLSGLLKPDGVMLIGGNFGAETRNVQFHATDEFESWSDQSTDPAAHIRVNKRIRSLADWQKAAGASDLLVVDLVRSDQEPGIMTPENDVLVLARAR
jgi:SAM-dependent methyltransferase